MNILTRVLLFLALAVAPVGAKPGYEYTFQSFKANMPDKVNYAASLGWEAFDVAFTNFGGYLVCYRRSVPPPQKPLFKYAFELATVENAEEKANAAAKNGWELYKLVSCAGKLYCLCFHQGPAQVYKFERAVGVNVEKQANAAAQAGWEFLDLGFGDVSGYLICYRKNAKEAPRNSYSFGTVKGGQIEATANEYGKQGWELLRLVSCTRTAPDLYGLFFRKANPNRYTYAIDVASGKNIEAKVDATIENGWELYRVIGDSAGDMDYSDSADIVRSMVPYTICYRR